MRREELKKRFEKTKDQISKRLIIPRAIDVIKEQGICRANPNSFFGFDKGSYRWTNESRNILSINYRDSFNDKGGGDLNILYDGRKVFGAKDCYNVLVKERDLDFTILLNDFYIYTYIPGNWEYDLKKLSKIKAPKPKKDEFDNEEIKKSLVSSLIKRFPSLEFI